MKEHCFLNNGKGIWKTNLNGTGRQLWERYHLPSIFSNTKEIIMYSYPVIIVLLHSLLRGIQILTVNFMCRCNT